MTRHGNNAHAELPPCPCCRAWAWRTGSVYMGGGVGTQITYTCNTPDCLGTGYVIYCGYGFAVLFERRPEEFDEIEIQGWQWLAACRAAVRSGSVRVDVLAPADVVCLHGQREWLVAAPGMPLLADVGRRFREAS